MFIAGLVSVRERAMTIASLGMRCDSHEFPDPSATVDVDGNWVGPGRFTGVVQPVDASGELGTGVGVTMDGMIAITVAAGRMYVIVAPESFGEPAVWIAADLTDVTGQGVDAAGFAKKPRAVTMSGTGGVTLTMNEVSKVFRRSGRFQMGQAASLLQCLAAPTVPAVGATGPLPPPVLQVATAPPAAWHPDPFGRFELRYWDGTGWTAHVSTAGRTSTDAPSTP